MKAGEAKVGQRVKTAVQFVGYLDLPVGTLATIRTIVAQNPGAETDSILIHPDGWPGHLSLTCESKDVELVEA